MARLEAEGVRDAPPVARLWMFADGADAVARDSVRVASDGAALWRLRVPPGDLYARAEAMGGTGGAARGTVFAAGLGEAGGVSMSDVIVAASVEDVGGTARRWHQLGIVPAPDTLPRSRSIALAWEIYGLRDGARQTGYDVRLTVEKASRSVAGRIAAQIGGLVGVQRGTDRVTLEFSRSRAAPGVALDHVALSLREAPAGRYALTVQVTDRTTGQKAARTVPLLIGR